MNDVEKFIKRFKTPENGSIFAGDCSYWFAAILYRRFIREGAKIMFDTATNHFGTMVNGKVYDITGDITRKYKWVPWLELQDNSIKEKVTNEYIMF